VRKIEMNDSASENKQYDSQVSDKDMDFMIQEITMGIDKNDSIVEMTGHASLIWDILFEQIQEIKEKGYIVDIPASTPSGDPPADLSE
jgi:hypothetical protein